MPKVRPHESIKPLLVPRKKAAQLLGCSIGKLATLEQQGRLKPIKLTGGLAGFVHYRLAEVEALCGVGPIE